MQTFSKIFSKAIKAGNLPMSWRLSLRIGHRVSLNRPMVNANRMDSFHHIPRTQRSNSFGLMQNVPLRVPFCSHHFLLQLQLQHNSPHRTFKRRPNIFDFTLRGVLFSYERIYRILPHTENTKRRTKSEKVVP